jgi:hypothetical protein
MNRRGARVIPVVCRRALQVELRWGDKEAVRVRLKETWPTREFHYAD